MLIPSSVSPVKFVSYHISIPHVLSTLFSSWVCPQGFQDRWGQNLIGSTPKRSAASLKKEKALYLLIFKLTYWNYFRLIIVFWLILVFKRWNCVMGNFCIFDTKFLIFCTSLKILTNFKSAMFWFGKKVESFFTKVPKSFPIIRNYSHTVFEKTLNTYYWTMWCLIFVVRRLKLIAKKTWWTTRGYIWLLNYDDQEHRIIWVTKLDIFHVGTLSCSVLFTICSTS